MNLFFKKIYVTYLMRKRNKNFTFKMTLKTDRCPKGYLFLLKNYIYIIKF